MTLDQPPVGDGQPPDPRVPSALGWPPAAVASGGSRPPGADRSPLGWPARVVGRHSAGHAPAGPSPREPVAAVEETAEPYIDLDAQEEDPAMVEDEPVDGAAPDDPTVVSRRRIKRVLDEAAAPDVSRETAAEEPPIAAAARRAVKASAPARATAFPRPAHRRTITVANQKGGVGKTTSTVNLAAALVMHGSRVLVIDLDPQGNASTGLGIDHHAGVPSIYEALISDTTLDDLAKPVEGLDGLWCVPATIDLAGSEIELVSVVARESRLQRALATFSREVDYVFIDCPPSLGLLTVNALVAADEVLIPIQCEYYALEGLGQLLRNIDLVRAHLNPRVRISTILMTMYDARTKLADQVAQEVREHFGDVVLNTIVPRSVRVSEAPGFGQSVMTYDPGSRGAVSYLAAAREIAERNLVVKEGA
jgi:chromosome partitioning protein